MPLSAWITCVLVSTILYGGFVWCLIIALRKGREGRVDGDEDR